MRSFVFLLVLGNILIFALSAGWFGGGAGDGAAAMPAENSEAHVPLSPDRIKIVSRGEPPPIPEQPKQCLDWRNLPAPQVAALEKLAAGNKLLSLIREETQAASASYWAYIPAPTGGKAASEKKALELKTMGVKSYQLVQEGVADLWAISLGVFDSEQAAAEALAAFKKAGVRSARQGVKAETPALFHVRLNGLPNVLAAARKLADPVLPADCTGDGSAPPNRAAGAVSAGPEAAVAVATPVPAPATVVNAVGAVVAPAQSVAAKAVTRP